MTALTLAVGGTLASDMIAFVPVGNTGQTMVLLDVRSQRTLALSGSRRLAMDVIVHVLGEIRTTV